MHTNFVPDEVHVPLVTYRRMYAQRRMWCVVEPVRCLSCSTIIGRKNDRYVRTICTSCEQRFDIENAPHAPKEDHHITLDYPICRSMHYDERGFLILAIEDGGSHGGY